MSRRWTVLTLCACGALLALCAGTVFLLDPFEHYRESRILPLYDQESYNNPGIARNYDYDAVILGTSMVEMSHPSLVDELFGVHAVKLPMRGSYTAQMGWQLAHVLQRRPLTLAILAVDAYSLLGRPDDTQEIVRYLWNDNPLDDVNYLLNRDVLFVRVPRLLQNIGKPLATKRDDMYTWTDVVFSRQSVLSSVTFAPQSPMAQPLPQRTAENIGRHLEPYIAAHPETRFCIYMPPYSVAYWYVMTRGGLSERQYAARASLSDMLLAYDNVEIYDFSSCEEWITDLDSYFDYSHHSGEISDALMRAMAAGEQRVHSTEQMQAGSQRIRRAVEAFAKAYEPDGLGEI